MNDILRVYSTIKAPTLSQKEEEVLCKVAIAYIMQVYTFNDIKRELKIIGLDAPDCLHFRAVLSHNFSTALGIKMAVINWCASPIHSRQVAEKICKANDICLDNAPLLTKLKTLSFYDDIMAKVSDVEEPTKTAIFYKNVVARKDFLKLNNLIKYNCFKKLTFIRKANNMLPEDLEDEVREMLLHTFYKVAAFQSEKHRQNSLVKSLHNIVLKRLYHYNTLKRQRMKGSDDYSFSMTCETLSNLEDSGDEENSGKMMYGAVLPDENFITEMTINKFIANGPPGRAKIVNLLTCKAKEPTFLRFVSQNYGLRGLDDCEQVIDRIGHEKYYEAISNYLTVPRATIDKVRTNLYNILTT